MKSICLTELTCLNKEYLHGNFYPDSVYGGAFEYRLCENKKEDDGRVYVVVHKDFPDSFKEKAESAIKRILSGTIYSDRKIEFVNTSIPYVEDSSSC